MSFIKNQIKSFLKSRGLEIVPYSEYRHSIEAVDKKWIQELNIKTVIDVGGGAGQFASKTRKLLPAATIHTFEAIPQSYEFIKNKFAGNSLHKVYNAVLSDRVEQVTFSISSNSGSSSLLEMADLHKNAYPKSSGIKQVEYTTTLLDSLIDATTLPQPLMLKLDVQGAELKVLGGAAKILSLAQLVFMEMSFSELYKGQPLFNEVANYMYERGFQIAGIENTSQSPIDGSYLQCDAYFVKRNS